MIRMIMRDKDQVSFFRRLDYSAMLSQVKVNDCFSSLDLEAGVPKKLNRDAHSSRNLKQC
jgi:hypothetical protein